MQQGSLNVKDFFIPVNTTTACLNLLYCSAVLNGRYCLIWKLCWIFKCRELCILLTTQTPHLRKATVSTSNLPTFFPLVPGLGKPSDWQKHINNQKPGRTSSAHPGQRKGVLKKTNLFGIQGGTGGPFQTAPFLTSHFNLDIILNAEPCPKSL